MRDLYNNLKVDKSLTPIVGNNTTEGTGASADLAGYEGALMIAQLGVSLDTLSGSVKVSVGFEESVDNSAWTSIAADDLLGGANDVLVDDPAEDDIVVVRGYRGSKRYVRVLVTFTGTHTNGFPIAALIIKGFPRHAPVTY